MAKNFYQKDANPDLLNVWADPDTEDVAARALDLAPLQQLQALPDEARGRVAAGGVPGFVPAQPDLASLDAWLEDEVERILDLQDYQDYSVKQETVGNVCDGDWFVPEAVEAFSSETPTFEAALAIDGVNSTGWQPLTAPASITFRLRTYRKNVESIRLWIPNNTLVTELQGLTIRAAQSLSQIDAPGNVVASDLDLSHDGSAWQTIPWDFKKRCRYIKLDIDGSNNIANTIAVRSIEARVITFQHRK